MFGGYFPKICAPMGFDVATMHLCPKVEARKEFENSCVRVADGLTDWTRVP